MRESAVLVVDADEDAPRPTDRPVVDVAVGVLIKPFRLDELLAAVEKARRPRRPDAAA